MSTTDGPEQRRGALARREFFTRPFAWVAHEPGAPREHEALPGLILLSVLKHVPEAVLLRITPVLRQAWTACICEAGVAYRNDSGQEGVVSLGPDGCAATRLFDGVRTLEQVAAELDAQLGMAPGSNAAIVREAFLILAEREVYHPNGPLSPLNTPLPEEGHYAQ